MRALLIVLAACGSTDDIHAVVACDRIMTEGLTCERACAVEEPMPDDIECNATAETGDDGVCSLTFESGGVRGCCLRDEGAAVLRFYECTEIISE